MPNVTFSRFHDRMRGILALLLALAGSTQAEEPNPAPWPPEGTAEVRAYVFTDSGVHLVLDQGKIHPGVMNPDGALLSKDQTARLIAAMNTRIPEDLRARCFTPRNAFVFLDAKGTPLAALNVCFECFRAKGQPRSYAVPNSFSAIADLFEELKLPVGNYANAKAFKEAEARAVEEVRLLQEKYREVFEKD